MKGALFRLFIFSIVRDYCTRNSLIVATVVLLLSVKCYNYTFSCRFCV